MSEIVRMPEVAEVAKIVPERLSEQDLPYFNEARARLTGAQAIYDFTQAILASKYSLQPGDQIMPDGTIIRVFATFTQHDRRR